MYEQLLELYEKLEPLGVVAPLAHTPITAKVGVLLDSHGNFMAAKYINEIAFVPCTIESESRTNNIAPHLIHDNLTYLGLPGYEKQHEAYITQLSDYVDNIDDALAFAVLQHMKKDILMLELRPILDAIPIPLTTVSVIFAMQNTTSTINHQWATYYTDTLPINGMCAITGKPDHIPTSYPSKIRFHGDRAKLFLPGEVEALSPGYIAGQKIIHALQWLNTGNDIHVGDQDGPLPNYVPLGKYAKMIGINPANVRQKILRGNLPAKKFGSEWFIDKRQPYNDKRRKENQAED